MITFVLAIFVASPSIFFHLLDCRYLLGKSNIISYIPDYKNLFKEDIQKQLYISRALKIKTIDIWTNGMQRWE